MFGGISYSAGNYEEALPNLRAPVALETVRVAAHPGLGIAGELALADAHG